MHACVSELVGHDRTAEKDRIFEKRTRRDFRSGSSFVAAAAVHALTRKKSVLLHTDTSERGTHRERDFLDELRENVEIDIAYETNEALVHHHYGEFSGGRTAVLSIHLQIQGHIVTIFVGVLVGRDGDFEDFIG
jgi:hypothetical protein